jgi:DivIVA domain-containing protein
VNGDEIRNTTFVTGGGYDVAQVDDLLRRIAAEIDADRPIEPLIENARFQTRGKRLYDTAAVDWFLDQLLLRERHPQRAGTGGDPWRDLDVTQLTRSEVNDPAKRPAIQAGLASGKHFREECANAWHEFGQQPGTHLRWRWVRYGSSRRELCTAEEQPLASLKGLGRYAAVSAGERNFTFTRPEHAGSSSPDIAEIAARSSRDYAGHFAEQPISGRAQAEASGRNPSTWQRLNEVRPPPLFMNQLVDEAGIPILYTSGTIGNRRTYVCISFPDQRWLRFFVRGTGRTNAIMTAVDQAGNRVARYRIIGVGYMLGREKVEITVHPDRDLTDELVLAITISAPWLSRYFAQPGGGGGG